MVRTRLVGALVAMVGAAIVGSLPPAFAQPPAEEAGGAAKVVAAYPYGYAFPVEIPGLGFAMPKDAFLDILAAQKLTPITNSAKTQFLVQPPGAPYSSAVYFFDSNAGEILTEIELRFADAARAKAYFDARFPAEIRRGGGKEFVRGDGVHPYSVKAWCHEAKVYIVATMPNTRWAGQN